MITDGSRLMPIDCIAQHNSDGELIPLRIRLMDDEGEYRSYTITECRRLDLSTGQYTADKVELTIYDLIYECHASVFGRDTVFRLYYNLKSTTPVWKMNKSYSVSRI